MVSYNRDTNVQNLYLIPVHEDDISKKQRRTFSLNCGLRNTFAYSKI